MYHVCYYVPNYWNIYCDATSLSTGCYGTLQEALSSSFSPTKYNLKEFEKAYSCKPIFSVDSLSDIEHLYPELLI